MKVLTCSRTFPAGHPRKGEPTYFVEKIWKSIWDAHKGSNNPLYPWWEQYDQAFPVSGNLQENIHQHQPKHHTIRSGSRFSRGDMASLRVWSGAPYRSKQIEFAQVEVKKVWPVEIYATEFIFELKVDGVLQTKEEQEQVALNDGLNLIDIYNWFAIHPKKKEQVFTGQIICWSNEINY